MNSIHLIQRKFTSPLPTPKTTEYYGSAIAVSPTGDRFAVGESGFHNGGNHPIGGVHCYEIGKNPIEWDFTIQQTLLHKNRISHSMFGSTVAFSQDGQTMVIAAPNQNNGKNPVVGRVFVYRLGVKNGIEVWKLRDELAPQTTYSQSLLGASLLVLQNGHLIVVGAPGAYADSGRVYFFQKQDDDHWSEVRDVSTMDSYNETRFGFSLSGSEDGKTIVVGSERGNRVFVFRYDDSPFIKTWVEEKLFVYAYGPAAGRKVILINRDKDRWDETTVRRLSAGADKTGMVVKVSKDGKQLVAITRTVLPDVKNIIGYTAVRDSETNEWSDVQPLTISLNTDRYAGTVYLTLAANLDFTELAISVCTGDFIRDAKFNVKPNGVYIYRNPTGHHWLECGKIYPPKEDDHRLFGYAMEYIPATNYLFITNPMANAEDNQDADTGAIYLANTVFVAEIADYTPAIG